MTFNDTPFEYIEAAKLDSANHIMQIDSALLKSVRQNLGNRIISFVGLMGSGKSSIGKRISDLLELQFVDSDLEIEESEEISIAEIFSTKGEDYFRTLEQQTILELLENRPKVLATGGGAFMNSNTRNAIKEAGIVVWLKADLEILMERVSRNSKRPLLSKPNPKKIMSNLISERYPVYAEADIVIQSRDVPHDIIVGEIFESLCAKLGIGV